MGDASSPRDHVPDPLAALSPLLAARVRRLAGLWELDVVRTLERILERGLFECEAELRARFTPSEVDAWRAAIVALQREPDDAGFALIGRAGVGANAASDIVDVDAPSPVAKAPGRSTGAAGSGQPG